MVHHLPRPTRAALRDLNGDGTFFVTDQEGHWTPKNRINRVKPGGFYGNMSDGARCRDDGGAASQPPA
jgi:hypothetical protein